MIVLDDTGCSSEGTVCCSSTTEKVDVRTMMAIGGWSDYSAIEPYLTEPTERRIGAAMRE